MDNFILSPHKRASIRSQSSLVTPKHFSEHLEILKKHTFPINLQLLCNDIKDNTIKNKTSVVTFDDGYSDNFYKALPLLQKYGIPATVFVTAGPLEKQTVFWWHQLENIFLSNKNLPKENLHVYINDKLYNLNFDQVIDTKLEKQWHVLMENELGLNIQHLKN